MRIQRRIVGRQVLATACVFAFSSTRPADGFVLPSTRPRVSGSCYFPCRSPQHSYTANYIRQESSAEAELEWEAGDVYEEFEQLERAIAIHQAEQNLNHYERIQRLQDFANQRRPLYPDLHKYIIGPFVAALGVTAICKTIPQQPSWIGGSLRMALALHFWTTVVAFPLLMYIIKRVKQPPPKPLPSELQDLGPEFSQFLPLTESEHDRRKRTDDCTMCLSEQVSSAVIGTACLSSFLAPDMRPALYLLTRLGALLSWYQYPKLLSDLTRQDQPRPVTWDVYAMQIIRKWQGSTWMLVPALAQVLMSLDWEVIGQIYGAVGVAYVAARIRPSLFSGETNLLPSLLTLMTVLATAAWLFDQQRVIQLAVAVVRIVGVQNRLWRFVLVRNLGPLVPFVLAALPTLIHIVAFRKVMRVSKISNVSLASNVEEYQQASETPVATATWRWRTAWRDPQRMGATIRRWWGDFVYGIFLSGSVEDKLLRESIRRRRSLVAENSVLSRLSRELSTGDPAQRPSPDRSLWKAQAMGRLKQKHEQDYARGVYDDPLGVAVYRVLGAGLGFKYDHMKPLREGQPLSMRRLHSRAAKSAIRRANDLLRLDTLQQETSNDGGEREQKTRSDLIKQEAVLETQYLARRLEELVPPVYDFGDGDEKTLKIDQLFRDQYVKTSDTEYSLQRQPEMIIMDMFRGLHNESQSNQTGSFGSGADEEFVDAWADQRNGGLLKDTNSTVTCLA